MEENRNKEMHGTDETNRARGMENLKGLDEGESQGRSDRHQTHDTGGEAQNVEEDRSGRLESGEAERARDKAMEGQRQERDRNM